MDPPPVLGVPGEADDLPSFRGIPGGEGRTAEDWFLLDIPGDPNALPGGEATIFIIVFVCMGNAAAADLSSAAATGSVSAEEATAAAAAELSEGTSSAAWSI